MINNNFIEKIFRTIGFILIFLGSIFLLNIYIGNILINIKQAENILIFISDIETKFELSKYSLIFLTLGSLCLLWTQNKASLLREFLTIVSLLAIVILSVLNDNKFGNVLISPFNLSNIAVVKEFVLKNNVTYPYLEALSKIIPVFIFYLVLVARKPKRISFNFLKYGFLIILIGISLSVLPNYITFEFLKSNFVSKLNGYIFAGGFLSNLIGAAFGIIGVFRK